MERRDSQAGRLVERADALRSSGRGAAKRGTGGNFGEHRLAIDAEMGAAAGGTGKERARAGQCHPQGNEIQRREERQERRMGLSMDGTMIYIRG